MKEREISLIDLMFAILLKWRMIIGAMVIGGVLLGGYSYFQSIQTANQAQMILSDAETLANLEKNLSSEEKTYVRTVLGFEDYSEYYRESVLMQIDANNVPTIELVFAIGNADEKTTRLLIRVYEQLFETGISEWLVQGGMDTTEASKVNELIITENEVINQFSQSLIENEMINHLSQALVIKEGIMYITVVHADEEKCQELANQVVDFVSAKKQDLEQEYGSYEVTLVNCSYACVLNEEILSKQRDILQDIYNGITYRDKLKHSFSSEQSKYYSLLKKGVKIEGVEDIETPATVVKKLSPSINSKYIVLGMLLFALLEVFWVFVVYIFNNKLRANDDMTELYEIPQLGIISKTNKKKKFLGFIDAWIIALRDRNKRKFTEEEAKEIVAVAIKMAVKKSDSKDVCLIGCDVKKQIEDICGSIKVLLEKEGIKVSVLDNVLYNAEEMEKLSDAGNAVIIEKTGATMYDEVAKELELLKRYNINILGGVLVD